MTGSGSIGAAASPAPLPWESAARAGPATAAIRQAGSTEGPKIREALENLKEPVDGVLMRYSKPFTKDDHELFKDSSKALMATIRKGEVVRAADGK